MFSRAFFVVFSKKFSKKEVLASKRCPRRCGTDGKGKNHLLPRGKGVRNDG